MPFDFVYFDAGDVLFVGLTSDEKWYPFLTKIGIPQDKQKEFDKLYGEYEPLFNLGKMHADDFMKIAIQKLNLGISPDFKFQSAMINEFKPIPRMHELVKRIRHSTKIGLLTNMYPGMLNEVMKGDALPDIKWDVLIDSSKIHMMKPNKDIYLYAQQQANTPPKKILFIDNSKKNTDAAARLGWQVYFYDQHNIEKATAELEQLLLHHE